MTESAIHSRAAKLNLTVHTADYGKYYLTDSDGFVLSPGLMTQEVLEQWFDIGEVKRIEKALSDRAAKLDLMVKKRSWELLSDRSEQLRRCPLPHDP